MAESIGLRAMAVGVASKFPRLRSVIVPARGRSVFLDILLHLPRHRMETIFDVGANFGQSAKVYARYYWRSKIYCFEPVESTFGMLRQAVGTRCEVRRIALGEKAGIARIDARESAAMAHLSSTTGEGLEQVQVDTVDNVCAEEQIERISFMKVDTEGHDLNVLIGADRMLSNHAIDLVQVEAGTNPRNERHVPLETLKAHLESKGYFLFGIYEQVTEWPTRKPHLRRVNAVFISETASDRNAAESARR